MSVGYLEFSDLQRRMTAHRINLDPRAPKYLGDYLNAAEGPVEIFVTQIETDYLANWVEWRIKHHRYEISSLTTAKKNKTMIRYHKLSLYLLRDLDKKICGLNPMYRKTL